MILYTDTHTYKKIIKGLMTYSKEEKLKIDYEKKEKEKEGLPYIRTVTESQFFAKYPKCILAEVNWPYFSNSKGEISKPLLRTLRYHALDLFPNKDIHIRDADSIFVAFHLEIAREKFVNLISNWECEYIKNIESIRKKSQIIIGTHFEYFADYHYNLVYPTPFQFPIYTFSSRQPDFNMENPNVDHFLYVKRQQNPYGTSSERQKFFANFENKYMFLKNNGLSLGVYAGFVSVLRDRRGIEDFWKLCTEYLFQRYRMLGNVTTNELFQAGRINRGYSTVARYAIGKDERMLIYAIVPKFLDKIFFFEIPYATDISRMSSVSKPNYSKYILSKKNNRYNENFKKQSDNYKNWYEEFIQKYPTEDIFLNAVETNFAQEIKPYDTIPRYNGKEISNRSPYVIYNKTKKLFNRTKKGGKQKTIKNNQNRSHLRRTIRR